MKGAQSRHILHWHTLLHEPCNGGYLCTTYEYHRQTYCCVIQIFTTLAAHPLFANICTCEIFVKCTQICTPCECPCCSTVVCHCFVTSSRSTDTLPTPCTTTCDFANKLQGLVSQERNASTKTRARGSYGRWTAKQWAQIGKYASENENTAAARQISWRRSTECCLLSVTAAVIELPSKEEGAKRDTFGGCPIFGGVLQSVRLLPQWRYNCHVGYSSLTCTWGFSFLCALHALVNLVASDARIAHTSHSHATSISTTSARTKNVTCKTFDAWDCRGFRKH